jgi:hypothetical protein
MVDEVSSAPTEDKRLERLYDYTKFHIGIYLSFAGGLAALIGSLANDKAAAFFVALVGSPLLVGIALLLMMAAGACAGIVASSIAESRTFTEFSDAPQGPSWLRRGPTGRTWVALEHGFFWGSLIFILASILVSGQTARWLVSWKPPVPVAHQECTKSGTTNVPAPSK